MKQLTLNGKNYLFVPVPDDAGNFKIDRPLNEYMKYFHLSWNLSECEISDMAFFFKDFGGRAKYPKDMQFLTTTTDITEEQAAGMVERLEFDLPVKSWAYKNYVDGIRREGMGTVLGYSFAYDSFESLLSANNIVGRHAIIEIL